MISAGIDIGSISAKAAVLKDGQLLGVLTLPSGYDHLKAAGKVLDGLLEKIGLTRKQINAVISTGYGRASVGFADKAMTEILCHGTGAHFLNPGVRGVIDIGGQDSKAILLDETGKVADFAMNDKCAAGTGRFLEVMAKALDVKLNQLADFSARARKPSKISSICTVFAESEVISMIARQENRENIIAGIHDSAAARVAILARKIKIRPPVMLSGGVARNKGMVSALARQLGTEPIVSDLAQENGAIGAAVLAAAL